MEALVWDNATLEDLNIVMTDASICGLGQGGAESGALCPEYFSHEVV